MLTSVAVERFTAIVGFGRVCLRPWAGRSWNIYRRPRSLGEDHAV